jgi:hypothetical protein
MWPSSSAWAIPPRRAGLTMGPSSVPVVHGINPEVPSGENPIYMYLHTYLTESALAAEPSGLPGRHVICAGVVDDRTRDG